MAEECNRLLENVAAGHWGNEESNQPIERTRGHRYRKKNKMKKKNNPKIHKDKNGKFIYEIYFLHGKVKNPVLPHGALKIKF